MAFSVMTTRHRIGIVPFLELNLALMRTGTGLSRDSDEFLEIAHRDGVI